MAAARENEVGRCQCPICRSDRASLRVSGKSLAYVVCNSCNAQIFARSERSDELLRQRLVERAADPTPAPTPAKAATVPAPAAKAAPLPSTPVVLPPSKGLGWGLFR